MVAGLPESFWKIGPTPKNDVDAALPALRAAARGAPRRYDTSRVSFESILLSTDLLLVWELQLEDAGGPSDPGGS